MARGFVYLAAVVDWFSRRVLSHRVSITMEADFCVEALEEALARHGKPGIFNTDQGSQFTSEAFTGVLIANEIKISMDGKGASRDNVFVERIWKSVKYEEVYLHAYDSVGVARASIGRYLDFTTDTARTRRLTDARRTRPTSTRRPVWRLHEFFRRRGVGCDYGRATPYLRHTQHHGAI
ncbi:transposase InsO family protein [Rhodoblastus sphagnicola]|nr:transposase InsO family protein [Rhodoblastus sphagnicola]